MSFIVDKKAIRQIETLSQTLDFEIIEQCKQLITELYKSYDRRVILKDGTGFAVWDCSKREAEYHSYDFKFAQDRFKNFELYDISQSVDSPAKPTKKTFKK